MFTRGSLTLFHVRGVPIRAHWSLLLAVPYLAFALSAEFSAPWWGVLLALALFASVMVHELAHVWVARRHGGRVRGITLMLLGGVSHVMRVPPGPRHEAMMAAAGPAVSLGLGVVFAIAYGFAVDASHDVRTALFYLSSMNLTLGVFNLLPAFPMDGGRILRAALASRLGYLRATKAAAMVGRGIAIAMAAYGLTTGNLVLVLIAIFVFVGAGAEAASERARTALEGLRVRDLLPPLLKVPTLGLDAPMSDALLRMRMFGRNDLVVLDSHGAPFGVLLANDLAAVPPGARLSRPLRELADAIGGRHLSIGADEPAVDALEHAASSGRPYLVISDSRTHTVSLVTARDVSAAITLRLAEPPQPVTPPMLARRGAR